MSKSKVVLTGLTALLLSLWQMGTGGQAMPVAPSPSPETTYPDASYTVIYTGRLFGYFRYPEVEDLTRGLKGCPLEVPSDDIKANDEVYAPEAARFLRFLEEQEQKQPAAGALVGVGDNFAPFLLARRAWGRTTSHPAAGLLPKEDFAATDLKYDNVVCFMRLAGFAAVVPGKHDFYFGPEQLRRIENLLSKDLGKDLSGDCSPEGMKQHKCYRPVRMLGANLSLKAQKTNSKAADKGERPATGKGKLKLGTPKVVMPWMRAINVSFTGTVPDGQSVDFSLTTTAGRTRTQSLELQPDPHNPTKKGQLTLGPSAVLEPWVEYHVMMKENGKAPEDLGQFTVAEPFFGGDPWTIATTPGGPKIAIFGVVDPDMDLFVGRLNYTWLGLKKGSNTQLDSSYETIINASDPAEALNQALQLCAMKSEECRNAPKILLAEMPESEIHQNLLPFLKLPAGTRPFDAVITQADPDAATSDRNSKATASALEDLRKLRPSVLVPGAHFYSPSRLKSKEGGAGKKQGDGTDQSDDDACSTKDDPYCVRIRLQVVSITSKNAERTVNNHISEQVKLNQDRPPKEVPDARLSDPFNECRSPLNGLTAGGKSDCGQGHTVFSDTIRSTHVAKDTLFENGAPQDWPAALEEISLRIMRDACNSDIAMIQHRDVFYAPRLVDRNFTPDEGLSAAIGAIFWKGDFIQCINIPGQTLTSILQRSQELERAEAAGEYTDLSLGWAMAYTGIEPAEVGNNAGGGEKPEWLVHGDFLDPKRLYSVAITDYLANGDTGYPDLQNAQPDPQTSLARLHLWTLTDHLHARITGTKDRPRRGGDEDVLDRRDESAHVPAATNQDTFFRWIGSLRPSQWNASSKATSVKTPFDFSERQRPTTFIRLYKADFGYSLFQHNVNEADIGAKFPGVTAVDLSNPDSEAFNADLQLRVQRDTQRWATYAEGDANFGRRNQRGKNAPFAYQPSQTSDIGYFEIGEAFKLWPGIQNPSGLRFILPTSLKTQIVRPYTQITPINAKSSGGSNTVPVSAARNYYWAFRPGLRFEHNFPRAQNNSAGGSGGGSGSGASSDATAASAQGGKGQGKSGQQGGGSDKNQSSTLNSFIEFGFQTGKVFHSPSVFTFANPGTADPACSSGQVVIANLIDCISSLGTNARLTSVAAGRNFRQEGAYLNFRIDAPLPGRSSGEYIIENRGDIFFNRASDAPIDVRFLDDMKHSLQLPLYGKFTVGPSIELVFFKTKVTGNRYFSYSTSVSLNYSFDWHPGLSWPKALGFGGSLPAPNPLPTK